MNKTLYLKDEDGPVWDRARELAGDKISPVVVEALKKFVAEKEAEPRGFERILLEFNDAHANGMPTKKAFFGRWIVPAKEGFKEDDETDGSTTIYSVAQTAKGNVVVFKACQELDGYVFESLSIYPSFAEALAKENARLIRLAISRVGVPVEELDI